MIDANFAKSTSYGQRCLVRTKHVKVTAKSKLIIQIGMFAFQLFIIKFEMFFNAASGSKPVLFFRLRGFQESLARYCKIEKIV